MNLIKLTVIHAGLCFCAVSNSTAQSNYSDNPLKATFETSDVRAFWEAYDRVDMNEENPFKDYIRNGTEGLHGFIENRIINADSLLITVKKRRSEYERSRHTLDNIILKEKRIKAIYASMKYWYPNAKFPPIYFLYGRFNSAGTVSDKGILIGVEMLNDLNGITGLVGHELIHFQQNINGVESLLKQSLIEGGADFISELITGENINQASFMYGEKNSERLCREFVRKLKGDDYEDWLYSVSNKDDRPNDLGYWLGYKICQAYFNRQADKHQAIVNIINIEDPILFLRESHFLDVYVEEFLNDIGKPAEDFYKMFSDEAFRVSFVVKVKNKDEEIFITGNQANLGNWDPSKIKLQKISNYKRKITIEIHLPARFKFTKGSWEQEAWIEGAERRANLKIDDAKQNDSKEFRVIDWIRN